MPDTNPVVPVAPKTVGLFQDPHFIGIITQIAGVAVWGASHLALIPTPAQPWFALAGGIVGLVGSAFHIQGLMDPALTQTPPSAVIVPFWLVLNEGPRWIRMEGETVLFRWAY